MHSFFFRELQLITVLLLIHDSYMSLPWRQVKEEWIFMYFFSKRFGEKYKHTELALNFAQKQKNPDFLFILVK